jgi:hypothetical protein
LPFEAEPDDVAAKTPKIRDQTPVQSNTPVRDTKSPENQPELASPAKTQNFLDPKAFAPNANLHSVQPSSHLTVVESKMPYDTVDPSFDPNASEVSLAAKAENPKATLGMQPPSMSQYPTNSYLAASTDSFDPNAGDFETNRESDELFMNTPQKLVIEDIPESNPEQENTTFDCPTSEAEFLYGIGKFFPHPNQN